MYRCFQLRAALPHEFLKRPEGIIGLQLPKRLDGSDAKVLIGILERIKQRLDDLAILAADGAEHPEDGMAQFLGVAIGDNVQQFRERGVSHDACLNVMWIGRI